MFFSLAIILLGGLGAGALFKKLRLPAIIGMLLVGVLAGPCVLNLFDESILSISADLRKTALVIILMKAGLSLDLGDLGLFDGLVLRAEHPPPPVGIDVVDVLERDGERRHGRAVCLGDEVARARRLLGSRLLCCCL